MPKRSKWLTIKVWMRLLFGLTFIRCKTPNDILVVRRYGGPEYWNYQMEALAGIISPCGHAHPILFTDAEFRSLDVTDEQTNSCK